MQLWMWLALSGVLVVVEILTVDLLFASLAFSTLMAAIANAFGLNGGSQGAIFAIAAALSLFVLRPIAMKHLKKRPADFATNMEALIGASAIALSEITDNSGQITLNGEVWSARSEAGAIATDAHLQVVSIDGATAVVKKRG